MQCPICGGFMSLQKVSTPRVSTARSGSGGGGCGLMGLVRFAVLLAIVLGVIAMCTNPEGATDPDDPASGARGPNKIAIKKCGEYYFYYDTVLMQEHGGLGYTISRTPPYAEVEFIEELHTYRDSSTSRQESVSSGRQIPRHYVMPVENTFGDYYGDESCRNFYYKPPSTAGAQEKEAAGLEDAIFTVGIGLQRTTPDLIVTP